MLLKILTVLFTVTLFSDALEVRDSVNELENYVRAIMKCRNVPGLSLALVKGGKNVYVGGFGHRNIKTRDPLTATSLLNIGSESKAFTSTIIARAVAEDLVTWDKPLKDIFPEGFQLQDNFRTQKASLRDLLSHRLGMPSYWGVSTAVMNLTIQEIAQRVKDFPVLYGFRQRFLYTNYGFVVAGAALERVTGETWSDSIHKHIFQPLNMTGSRTSTTLSSADWDNLAYSNTLINSIYVQNPEKDLLPIAKEINPAAGVFTNAEDMAKWIKFHLSVGKDPHGRQLIPRSVLEETYQANMAIHQSGPTRKTFPVENLHFAYGLGWMKGVYRGYAKTYHTGSYSSYSATLTLLPEVDAGVWVGITGSPNGDEGTIRDVITMYALDLLVGQVTWLNTTTGCSYPSPWKHPGPSHTKTRETSTAVHAAAHAAEYVGDYTHPAFGEFHVTQDNGQLKYRMGLLLRGDLNWKSRDHFYQTLDFPLSYRSTVYPQFPNGFHVTFQRNNQNNVASVQIPYLEFDEPPVFDKILNH